MTDTVNVNDFRELRKFSQFLDLLAKKRKARPDESELILQTECYKEIYGEIQSAA